MDPRPYTYEYRKPRLSNPTYHSQNLYESIYHIGAYGKRFALYNPQTIPLRGEHVKQSQNRSYQLQRVPQPSHPSKPELKLNNSKNLQSMKIETNQRMKSQKGSDGRSENGSRDSQNMQIRHSSVDNYQLPPSRQHYMSNYGNRLMKPIPGSDQDRIYERQEKRFNIVTNDPKQYQIKHRKFPKYTLENKLFETSTYRQY